MIDANRSALESGQPALLAALRETAPLPSAEVVRGKRGMDTVVWSDREGRKKYLHSPVDPVEESRRLAESVVGRRPVKIALLIGHGLGYEIRALLDRVSTVLVLAVNLPLLRRVSDSVDLSDLFSHPRVKWFFGSPEDISRRLTKWIGRHPAAGTDGEIEVILHAPFVDTIPDTHRGLIVTAQKLQAERDTEDRLRPLAESNIRVNRRALDAPGSAACFGMGKRHPAIVVAAGPTLDDALDRVRQMYPVSILIAADTVAEGLVEEGLPPDFIVSIDPQPESLLHFGVAGDVSWLKRSALIFTPISHPDVVNLFEGRRLLAIPHNHFFFRPAEAAMAHKGVLMGGGSVSILAASFAAALQPFYVALAGFDFRSSGTRFYSRLASYHRRTMSHPSRFSSIETAERDILDREIRRTFPGEDSPRLRSYASDFRLIVQKSCIPFYSFGASPIEGVRSGSFPCVDALPVRRPLPIPSKDDPAPPDVFERLGLGAGDSGLADLRPDSAPPPA